jgi:CobQ-like glutamine amidotransferase family enzyme
MVIEILYPEFCNLFGDTGNVRFLKACLPDAEFCYTPLTDTPVFTKKDVDLIYMGPMSESAQLKVIDALRPHKDRLQELIEQDVPILFIGNACEVFCQSIDTPDGKVEGLGILPYTAKQEMIARYNGLTMGTFEDMTILGFRSQFTFGYGDNSQNGFLNVLRGAGLNPDAPFEGFRIHNMIATYLLGPILVVNPQFTRWLLSKMGVENPTIPFEDELIKAYEIRKKEFEDPKVEV